MTTSEKQCKLCSCTRTIYRFSLPLVNGHHGHYFECERCKTLESYHLDSMSDQELEDFYANCNPDLDSGAAWRQYCIVTRIEHLVNLGMIPRKLKGFKVLDFGCGAGFVVNYLTHRLGWNVVGYDPFATSTYSPSRVLRDWETVVKNGPYNLVIASEVFEHFRYPKEETSMLQGIVTKGRAFVFMTTGLYIPEKRTQAWHYLAPQSGQHVTFYSIRSLQELGHQLNSTGIYNVGAENEWLLVLGSFPLSVLLRFRFLLNSFLLRKAVRLGILLKIE